MAGTTFRTLKERVASELGMLSDDGTTIIEGDVTLKDIEGFINQVYTEVLYPIISTKYPNSFTQETYPINTFTASGVVDSSSTSTSLIATTSIFNNTMEGLQIYNATDDEYATIETYVSDTEVTLENEINNTWDGDTIYVLGNIFVINGETEDIKEIQEVWIKYRNTDEFVPCRRIENREAFRTTYSAQYPVFYHTSVKSLESNTDAIGIMPRPTNYDGKMYFVYIEKFAELSADGDIPRLTNSGITEPLFNYAVARGKRKQLKFDEAKEYEEYNQREGIYYPKGTHLVLRNYKPKSRSGGYTIKESQFIIDQKNRRF